MLQKPLTNNGTGAFRRFYVLALCTALAALEAGAAPVFLSFQEGNFRQGVDRDTVSTAGTLLSSNYNMDATHVRSDNPTSNRDGIQLIAGTQASGNRLHILLGFDVSYIAELVGSNISRVDSVALILTHDNAGTGSNAMQSVHLTRPFNETTATWNNPHGDGTDAGGFLGTELRQRTTVGTRTTPATEVWGSPGWYWPDGGTGPDLLVEAVRGALTNGTGKLYILVKRTSETSADYFSRYKDDGDATPNYRPQLLVGIDSVSAVTVSVAATDALAGEPGTDTGLFTITRSGNTSGTTTVYYTLGGTATPGLDYATNGLGSVTFGPGQTTASVWIVPLNDTNAEPMETVTLTITPDPAYTIATGTATIQIYDDVDNAPANLLAGYYFNENNNSAASLGAVASAYVPEPEQILASNATAGAGLGLFGPGGTSGTSHGYGTASYYSPPSSLYIRCSTTGTTQSDAYDREVYVSFTFGPQPGHIMSLTGMIAQARLQAPATNSVTILVRGSPDGFDADLAAFTVQGNGTATNFTTLSWALPEIPWSSIETPVELRFYVLSDSRSTADIFRLDDVQFLGTVAVGNPSIPFVSVRAEPSVTSEAGQTSAGFVLNRRGGDIETPLTVYYDISGTASNGLDYILLDAQATFAAGQTNLFVEVRPIDDSQPERAENVILTLLQNTNYLLTAANTATVWISDDDKTTVFLEAESFDDLGGWVVDQQFTDLMGSSYVMAHGLGRPVADARTTVFFPAPGDYRLWVRCKDWTAPLPDHPGAFKVIVGGMEAQETFGTVGQGWLWQDGGVISITNIATEVRLHDLTGFDGRCDALFFAPVSDPAPPNDLAQLRDWRRLQLGLPDIPPSGGNYDLVVVGGGIAGTAAAIAAARQGIQVALIHDRPFLGGNASQDIRVHTLGRDRGGIVSEINTPDYLIGSDEFKQSDQRRHQVVQRETNIHLFLEWRAFGVVTNTGTNGIRIVAVDARHTRSNEERRFYAPVFIDSTGDGWIGYWAGALHRMGREGKDEFGESLAPATGDSMTMGSTLSWYSRTATQPVSFPDVPWATNVSKGYYALRGDWYWEYGLLRNTVYDAEEIRDHLLKAIYGTFWTIKQSPTNANRELGWVAYVAGKRESRRLIGDYILTEQDVRSSREFPDAVVTESREIDLHYPQGGTWDFLTYAQFTSIAPYWIPFRCFYSTNVENLMMAGRCLSATHVGLGSPRVMNTCGQMGVATGTAAALCKKYGVLPRGVYRQHIAELQVLIDAVQASALTNVVAIVDNADTNRVQIIGTWQSSTSNPGYYGTDYLHDQNSGKGQKSVRFIPDLPMSGQYRVYARWTEGSNRPTNTPVTVYHRDGSQTVYVNQQRDNGLWIELGTFPFAIGNQGSVLIENRDTTGYVIADAVAFVSAFELAPAFTGEPWQDDDSDGVPNYIEFLNGTNPHDAASAVRLFTQRAGTQPRLQFHAVPGRSYVVQISDRMPPGGWLTLTNIPPASGTRTIELLDNISPTNRFYRIFSPAP